MNKFLQEDDLIYHYCSVETFLEIIKNKSFRFSNTFYMNDQTDFNWFKHLLDDKIKEAEAKGDFIEEMFKKMSIQYAYACCFSKKGDDLSQWRAYSDDGRGVSIGILKNTRKLYNKNIELIELIYEREKQKILVEEFINLIKNKEAKDMDANEIIKAVASLFKKIKNPSFACEDEVRLLYLPEIDDMAEYYVKNNNIVDYYDILFEKISASEGMPSLFLIQKIYLGPKCELEEGQVERFLRKMIDENISKYPEYPKAPQIKVERTKIPYR